MKGIRPHAEAKLFKAEQGLKGSFAGQTAWLMWRLRDPSTRSEKYL